MSFEQKVVLITGGSSVIGATTAVSFAQEGASIAIVGRNEDKLKEIALNCEKLGAVTLTIKADVSKDEEADLIVKETIEKFGKLDVLVNHAEISKEAGILADNFLKTYDEVTNVNMRGAIRITYFAVPYLIKTKGNIVYVPNMTGISTSKTLNIAYRTSKAAMMDFTKTVALELAVHEVRAITIYPVPDHEAIFNRFKDNLKDNVAALQRLDDSLRYNGIAKKRLSDPNMIADMILYVSSNRGKDITGCSFWLKLWASNRKKDRKVCTTVIKQLSTF